MKRSASLIVVLFVLGTVGRIFAGDPVNFAAGSLASWKGKHTNDLFAELGKPDKTKRDGDGKVLVYRLRFYGSEVVGKTEVTLSAAGVGASPDHPEEIRDSARMHGAGLSFGGGLAVVAKQKVKFYVDADGIVTREEFGPRKWKKRRD